MLRKQSDIAKRLGLSTSFFCHIINGQRRPSSKKALELEGKTGISIMIWLYGDVCKLRKELEAIYGKINFGKGRLPKSKQSISQR